MRRMLRWLLAALVTITAVAVPAAAHAATEPDTTPRYGCLEQGDGYTGPLPCQVDLTVLQPVCDNDVPKLRYVATPVGTPNQTVTITFVNPSGASVVYADQPLSGTVLWPGAVVGPDGKGADWPGWTRQADGTWVQGDEFDWVRPSVQVKFQVNPEATVAVAYPPSSPACLTDPAGGVVLAAGDSSDGAVLSATGTDAAPIALAAGGLVVLGGLVLLGVVLLRRHRVEPTA